MNARFVTTATLITAFACVLTAHAADSQLLSLVMPDAKVLAGVNVDQAKASPFGVWVLTQMQSNSTELKQLIALTNFDPTRDVHELLAATNATPGSGSPVGLVLARGNFDVATITSLAKLKGAVTEAVGSVTIIEDPKQQAGIAFLDPTLVIAGDVGSVKAAIARQSNGQALPTAVTSLVNQWSGKEDAWVVMTVPPASLMPSGAMAGSGATPTPNPMAGMLQQIQQVAGGVKFGDSVVGTAAIQSDNATDATQLGNTLQFLVNLMQMQSQNSPQAANLAQAVSIATQGSTVNVTVSLPQAQFQQLIQQEKKAVAPAAHGVVKK